MDVSALIARMDAQREHWADLGAGKRLKFRRPVEVEMPRLMGGVQLDHVIEYACGWEGFAESDMLGAAVGSSDAVPFSRELWGAYVRDHAEMISPVAQAMADVVTGYLENKAATAKN